MLRVAPRCMRRGARKRQITPYLGRQQRPRGDARAMSSQLPSVHPPVSIQLPSDSFQLLPSAIKRGAAEDELYKQQVQDVQQWWDSERYKDIKRPYSAEAVVSKRGSLQQTYPSSLMARKLFNLLQEKAKAGAPVHTSNHIMRAVRKK